MLRDIGLDFLPPDPEQGTRDLQFQTIDGSGTEGRHAREAARGGTAEEIEKERLDLIVGMVREKEPRAVTHPSRVGEKRITGLASGRFQGLLSFPRQRGDIDSSSDDEFITPLRGEPLDESGILGACRPQGVIEMADHEVTKPGRAQLVEQRHGVASTGNADETTFLRREARVHQPMLSAPKRSRNTSGMITVPSDCW